MYTQCPDCSTVFRVTAETLRAAQGRVRCGICSSGFNALDNLSEAPVPRPADQPRDEDTITVEELPGTEFIELSGAGDGEPEPMAVDEAPGLEQLADEAVIEAAEESVDEAVDEASEVTVDEAADEFAGEVVDESKEDLPAGDPLDGIPDTALEFHGSAEDLERLFVPAGLSTTGDEPVSQDLPQAIEDVASQDLSGIEVREEEIAWPASSESPFDPGNPAHVAAVLASSAAEQEARHRADLDPTDEYPVLVVEEYEAAAQAGIEVEPAAGEPQPDVAVEVVAPETVPEVDAEAVVLESEPAPEPESFTAEAETGIEAEPVGTGGGEQDADVEALDEAAEATVEDQGEVESVENAGEAAPATGDATHDEAAEEVALLIIPEELRRGPSATAADDLAAPLDLEEESPRRWPLVAAAALLLAVLGIQAVHHWRQDLVRDPATGPWMLRTYHALGMELQPPVDLGAFELRQLGAASDTGAAGRIKVRASIVNHAPFAQPYPLLRLTLQDRFGSTIGARNLAPAEYLPGGATDASGLLGAAQRADAEVVFVDPGREAVGFELDVCTESGTGLRCSADRQRGTP